MAKVSLQRLTVQEANNAKLGQGGSVFINDDAVHTGPFVAFIAITEAVLDISDCTTNIDGAADFTIPIGTTIYGRFDSLSIASGSILAYKG
jgi:uncharacterized protein YcgI (DUF1989 family)